MTAGDDTAPPAGTVSLDDLTPTSRERIVAAALHRQQMQQVRREVEMGIPTSLHEDVQPPWRCLGCLVAADVALRAAAAVDTALPGPTAGPRAGDTAPESEPLSVKLGRASMEAFARNHFTAPDDELCDPDGPPLNDYSTWTEYTVANAAEVARLRSEAAALRAAGGELSKWAASITPRSTFVDWGQRVRVVDAWRSAAGSPTAAPHPDAAAMFAEMQAWLVARQSKCPNLGVANSLHAVYGDVLDKLDEIVRGAPIGSPTTDGPARVLPEERAAETADELPATLRTVEDVAAVCEAAGLASGGVDVATGRINAWGVAPSRAAVQVDVDENGDLVDAIVFRFGHDYPIATVHRDGDPSPSLLLAAIRAAQGGT